MRLFYLSLVILLSAVPVFYVQASGFVPCGGPNEPSCTICHFFLLIERILYYALFIAGIISALIFIVCGLKLITDRGNPETTSKTKKIIFTVIAGLLIIFGGWAAVNTYFMAVGTAQWSDFSLKRDWSKINARCMAIGAPEKETICGDGLVSKGEWCDPAETLVECEARTGFSKEKCKQVISGCDPLTCESELLQKEEKKEPVGNDDSGNDDGDADDGDDSLTEEQKKKEEEKRKEEEQKKKNEEIISKNEECENDPKILKIGQACWFAKKIGESDYDCAEGLYICDKDSWSPTYKTVICQES